MDIGKTPTEHLHWQRLQSIISRVDPNHIYTVYIRYLWQEHHQIYGHIRCIHTVLANPINKRSLGQGHPSSTELAASLRDADQPANLAEGLTPLSPSAVPRPECHHSSTELVTSLRDRLGTLRHPLPASPSCEHPFECALVQLRQALRSCIQACS